MKSYYQQCKPLVQKDLKMFKNDFFKHDREQLHGAQNLRRTFVLLVRETGTHLIEIRNDAIEDEDKNFFHETIEILYRSFNPPVSSYLLKDGKVEKLDIYAAKVYMKAHVSSSKKLYFYL